MSVYKPNRAKWLTFIHSMVLVTDLEIPDN